MRQIQRDLCKCDIVEEVFSKYTSRLVVRFHEVLRSQFSCPNRYPELRELELKQLARTLLSADSSSVLRALKVKIEAYSCGQLPHGRDILPALYELMECGEAFKEAPKQPSAPLKQETVGEDWEELKDALTCSLTSGTFLDSQFYALDSGSRSGAPRIRPVYFCSTTGGTFVPKLLKRKSFGPGLWESYSCLYQIRRELGHLPRLFFSVQAIMAVMSTAKLWTS